MEIKATSFLVDPEAISGDDFYLSETESHHLAKVIRAREGDIFYAIDGLGKKYRAIVTSIGPSRVTASIIGTVRLENEPHLKLCLAIGLSRPAKIDFVVEKGTEIGIGKFFLFVSEKTLIDETIDLNALKKISRWRKIAESAAKQSLRSVVPEIAPPMRFDDVVALARDYQLALIADMNSMPAPLSALLADSPREILLLVGPESGFSEAEVDKALAAGFRPVRLGPRRLRTETAAIVFSTLVMSAAGEL